MKWFNLAGGVGSIQPGDGWPCALAHIFEFDPSDLERLRAGQSVELDLERVPCGRLAAGHPEGWLIAARRGRGSWHGGRHNEGVGPGGGQP